MIKVIDNYLIDCEGNNYIAGKKSMRTNRKDGSQEEVFVALGYYTTIKGALEGIRKEMQRNAVKGLLQDVQLVEFLEQLKEIDKRFYAAIKGIDA